MVECTLFMTHCLRLNLQLHTISLVMTCRISSFCTVAWQLARLLLTRRIVRSFGDSWASCFYNGRWISWSYFINLENHNIAANVKRSLTEVEARQQATSPVCKCHPFTPHSWQILIDSSRCLSCSCGQCHAENWGTRLNTNLLQKKVTLPGSIRLEDISLEVSWSIISWSQTTDVVGIMWSRFVKFRCFTQSTILAHTQFHVSYQVVTHGLKLTLTLTLTLTITNTGVAFTNWRCCLLTGISSVCKWISSH